MAHRPMFLMIGQAWIFYALAAIAVILFFGGLVLYLVTWKRVDRKGRPVFSWAAVRRTFEDAGLGKRTFKGDVTAGVMHLFIFWGFFALFMGTGVLSVHHYIVEFLRGRAYLVFSAAMELAGIVLVIGLLWAAVRRYLQRIPRLEHRAEDGLVLLWLIVVVVSGFMVEAVRLSAQDPAWRGWSFAGNVLAKLIPTSTASSLYPYLWWGHAVVSLGLIAAIPFTKLFHMLGAPASIYLQATRSPSGLIENEKASLFQLEDIVFFDACMRCGRCVEVCPSSGAGEPFAPRDFVQAVRKSLWRQNSPLGDIRFFMANGSQQVDEKLWYCTTCRACLEVCPVYGAAFEEVRKKMMEVIEEGTNVPPVLNQTLDKLYRYNSAWESSKKRRAEWARGLDVNDITKEKDNIEFCYFVGCTTSLDTRAQEIAKSLVSILQAAHVRFGILGKKEPCCGDIARRVGELGLFMEQVDNCISLFEKYRIEEVVTSSPHCFHTFRNDYPEVLFRTRHYALVLDELIASGRVKPTKSLDLVVTYHDPCYLGRHNGVFEEPRRVIKSIPGIELREMVHNGPDSLCCGGGGGRMWQEDIDAETKMSEIRIREAHGTGASIVVTACPLCLIMLEDARKVQGLEDELKVMDLNELVLMSL
ncbi:MAG: hypothetical protein DRH15_02730 [Deltaproteobacteria bacterium]|nr:MAG: hypothetical protein DRH15_02730 [Deltaproteobacteria bacterium]